MNCSEFRTTAIHALLGKASPAEVETCRAHVHACERCAADSRADAFVLELLRSQHVPSTSEGFRQKLMARFDAEIGKNAGVDSGTYLRFSFRERIEAQCAWIGYRFSNSSGLRIVAAAAIVLLGTFIALSLRTDRSVIEERDDERRVAREPTVPTPAPTAEQIRAERRADPVVPSEVAIAPPGPVVIEPAAAPVAPEIADELVVDDSPRRREEVEGENRYQLARFRMRDRFDGGLPTSGRDDVDRAVLFALRWLVEQQDKDGGFDPQYFRGLSALRVGTTSLVALCLMTNAERGIPGGVYRDTVSRSLAFIRASATQDGTLGLVDGLGERDFEYTLFNHALATIALAEHHILVGDRKDDPLLREALLKLADLSRRREPGQVTVNDATTAPWVALAFETARGASLPVDFDLAGATRHARSFVVALAGPDRGASGLSVTAMVGPQAAASALDSQFGGEGTSAAPPPPRLLLDHLRRPECREPTKIYFAALDLAARDSDAEPWRQWRDLAADVFMSSRKKDGSLATEYTFDWISEAGGDLYTTALAILALSVEQREAR